MIRVIEATPGAGKTNIVVEWLCKLVDEGFYDEIYTSINNLRIVGVKSIPEQFDWRTLNPVDPETGKRDDKKRLVVYDEAQYEDAFMKENRKENPVGKDLSTHRHYGMDIWLITQSSILLNSYVHANTGEHVFMYRPRKKKTVKVYWWSHIQKTLSKDAFKTADDEQTWRLNPSMFPLYTSTSGVTDGQTRKSTKLFSILTTAVIVFAFIGFMINRGVSSFSQMTSGSAVAASTPTKVLTVSPDKISGAMNGNEVLNDPENSPIGSNVPSSLPQVPDSSYSAASSSPSQPSQASNSVDNLFGDVSGFDPNSVANSIPVGAAMIDGKCWAFNSKSIKIDLPDNECQLYLPVLVASD